MFAALGGLLLVAMFSASAPPAHAGTWWDASWDYKREFTFDGTRPDNCQVKMTLDISDNFGAGHVNADFSDLRWLENDGPGERELDWWIESIAGDAAVIWLELTDNLDTSVFCYYGNAGASLPANENADQTFLLYDDFGSFDNVSKWLETDTQAKVSHDAENSKIRWTGGTGADYTTGISSVSTFPRPIVFEYEITYYNASFSFMGIMDDAGVTNADYEHSVSPRNDGTYNWYDPDVTPIPGIVHTTDKKYDYGFIALPANGGAWTDNTDNGWGDNYTNAGGNAVATLRVGIGTFGHQMRADNVIVRVYAPHDTVAFTIGSETGPSAIAVSAPTVTEALIDRDNDSALTSPDLSTTISVQVTQDMEGENVGTFDDNYVSLYVKDDDGNVVVDNGQPVSSTIIDENTKEYTFAPYNPPDDIADSALGWFTAYVVALDNAGIEDTWGYGALFFVDDLIDTTISQDNTPRHTHTISGDASSVVGCDVVALTNAWIVDNNNGTIIAATAGTTYDNNYAPSGNGSAYAIFENAHVDGVSSTLTYFYPNIVAGIVSITADNTLIDNHVDITGSGADTTAIITVVWEDNDNYDDFREDQFWIAIRDATDATIDNEAPTTVSYENENRSIISFTFDMENYALDNTSLGEWDASSGYADNWDAASGWFTDNVFSVDEAYSTINYTPSPVYSEWPITVSGAVSRASGLLVIAADNIWLIDNVNGTFVQGAGSTWSETYDVVSGFGENIGLTVRMIDGPLDGVVDNQSYLVSDNIIYQVELRWEDNGELIVIENFANHEFKVKFWWDFDNIKESSWQQVSNNVENFNFDTGGENVFLTRLADNYPTNYWRSRIPSTQGGILVFLLPAENATVYKYSFTLIDYTTHFYAGWMRMYREAGPVNDERWDASLTGYSFLIYQEYYKVRLFSQNGEDEHEIQHFQAENDLTPDPFTAEFYSGTGNVVFMYDIISALAWRDNAGYVAVQWTGDADTQLVTIRIYDSRKAALLTSAEYLLPISASLTWNDADNDNAYWVEVETEHDVFGTFSQWFSIGSVFVGHSGGVTGLPWGFPIALSTLAGFFAVAVMAMLWTREHVAIAPLGLMMFVVMLKIATTALGIPIMPIADAAMVIMFVLAVLWALSEGGE